MKTFLMFNIWGGKAGEGGSIMGREKLGKIFRGRRLKNISVQFFVFATVNEGQVTVPRINERKKLPVTQELLC